jgi:hypothetical protein
MKNRTTTVPGVVEGLKMKLYKIISKAQNPAEKLLRNSINLRLFSPKKASTMPKIMSIIEKRSLYCTKISRNEEILKEGQASFV